MVHSLENIAGFGGGIVESFKHISERYQPNTLPRQGDTVRSGRRCRLPGKKGTPSHVYDNGATGFEGYPSVSHILNGGICRSIENTTWRKGSRRFGECIEDAAFHSQPLPLD